MPFNTITFLVFFILFTCVFYFVSAKYKTDLLILGSCFFYGYSNIFNIFNLIITIVVTYFFANRIRKKSNGKNYLIIGVLLILLQLILGKYSNNFLRLFSMNLTSTNNFFNYFILPIGISFYSLQAISLLVDVHNKKYTDELNFKEVSLFLSFFPQSISGPIHRANELIPQFNFYKNIQVNNIVIGLKLMLWGYFCKLIIANKISIITTPIFSTFNEQDGLSLLISSLLYSLQIYFDFWGYSLIAIGVGRILGFSININFNNPYLAGSFKEFWHRWHITLSKWMRDYVYIPLGGYNKKRYIFFFISIFITFLVSGFWHGITLNFIIWGSVHAFLYLAENFIRKYKSIFTWFQMPHFALRFIRFFRIILFFVVISLTWLIFRTESFFELVEMLKKMMSVSNWSMVNVSKNFLTMTNTIYLVIIMGTLLFSQSIFLKQKTENIPTSAVTIITDSIFVCFCITLIILIGDIGSQEFLYFKF